MRSDTFRRAAIALFLAAGLAAAAVPAAPAAAKARAVFKELAWDFGKVKQSEVLSHEFVFKNTGDSVLVVERVETTCGCTAAIVSANRIEPGREGRIKVSLDTHGYAGRMTRYIYLVSNDAVNDRRELSVSADIIVPPSPRIELDRYNIDMGVCLEGESPSARIVIRNAGQLELSVDMAHEQIKFFIGGQPLVFPLLIAAGRSAEVEFRFPPQMRPGSLRDYVLVRSNDTYRSTQSVNFSRYVVTPTELRDLFKKYKAVIEGRN